MINRIMFFVVCVIIHVSGMSLERHESNLKRKQGVVCYKITNIGVDHSLNYNRKKEDCLGN